MPKKKESTPYIINKEISWLAFNARVLQEAQDSTVPLIERLRFLGIYSSNMDEFFRVRVATLNRLARFRKKAKKIIGHDPKIVLKKIHQMVLHLSMKFDRTYNELLKELADTKIFIINENQLKEEQREFVNRYFQQEVRPKLMPIMIDQVEKFPELRDNSIYLAACLSKSGKKGKSRYALIEVPTDELPRFVILPSIDKKQYIMLLDDVIRYGLVDIFSVFHYEISGAYTIKLTRDAELDIDDDLSQSYIKKISKSLQLRKGANPVRFIYDTEMPKMLLNLLVRGLALTSKDSIISGSRYHNFKDFMNFPGFGLHNLKYSPIVHLQHKDIGFWKSILRCMRRKDILLHFPYHSFHYVIDLLREASIDPRVTSIKISLYRVAKHSSIVHALINAVRNGKTVKVIMELQARFDEEANIYWANKLQEEGARVIYGVPNLKVHAKLCLITRKEKKRYVHYGLVGTGNFNEETARIYSDHCLFTCDTRITGEMEKVFEFFEQPYKVSTFKRLIVSPFKTRKRILKYIEREAENARSGKDSFIIIKANNLVDPDIIRALYDANKAGVEIKLHVRSMISLIPGVPGLSDRIQGIGIVDKFLEHTRIFVFCNAGLPKYFISSADLMPRNLDRRVEVTCPIYDKEIQEELRTFLDIQWSDTVKARIHSKQLQNKYKTSDREIKIRAQEKIYEYLKEKNSQRN